MAGYNDILLYENPRRKSGGKRRRRNQIAGFGRMKLPGPLRQWVNISIAEIVAATGGLAAATMIPPAVVKDTSTVLKKLTKVAIGLASAAGVAALAEGIAKGSGKAALFGGVAGTGVMSLGMFTNIQVGRKLITGSKTLNLGESRATQSTGTDEGIQISTT